MKQEPEAAAPTEAAAPSAAQGPHTAAEPAVPVKQEPDQEPADAPRAERGADRAEPAVRVKEEPPDEPARATADDDEEEEEEAARASPPARRRSRRRATRAPLKIESVLSGDLNCPSCGRGVPPVDDRGGCNVVKCMAEEHGGAFFYFCFYCKGECVDGLPCAACPSRVSRSERQKWMQARNERAACEPTILDSSDEDDAGDGDAPASSARAFTRRVDPAAPLFVIGDRVEGRFGASSGKVGEWQCRWYPAVVASRSTRSGGCTYRLEYDDGDVEEAVLARYVRAEPVAGAPAHLPAQRGKRRRVAAA